MLDIALFEYDQKALLELAILDLLEQVPAPEPIA